MIFFTTQFMVWTMESPVAIDVMNYLGYTPIPQDVSDTLVNQLTNIKCGDAANPVHLLSVKSFGFWAHVSHDFVGADSSF
jgi:hypothetical protein